MEVRSFNKILFGGAPLLEQIEEKEELEKQLGEMTFTQNTDDDDNATEENIDEDSIHKSQYLTLEDLEGKWIILSILGSIVVSLIIFVALAKKLKKPHKNLDAEKSTSKPAKKSNVGLAPMTKIEKKSISDADIVNDDLEEQIVKSQSETQIQDIAIAKCIALKLKSVENSLDHTNAELEKVRGEKEDLEKQLAEMIFTQNDDAEQNITGEDSIHKSSDVLNRMIEDCDQMIGKLNEKIEYLKFENEIEK